MIVRRDAGGMLQGAVQHLRIRTPAGAGAECVVLVDDGVQDAHHLLVAAARSDLDHLLVVEARAVTRQCPVPTHGDGASCRRHNLAHPAAIAL